MKNPAGDAAEDHALRFLEGRGLQFVTRNWRTRFGEIDLIMRQDAALVFVEVRLRSNPRFGGAAASVTGKKQARIVAAAQQYLAHIARPPACRFDVVLLDGSGGEPEWLRDAFGA